MDPDGTLSNEEEEGLSLVDDASIIRLLRLFLGAVRQTHPEQQRLVQPPVYRGGSTTTAAAAAAAATDGVIISSPCAATDIVATTGAAAVTGTGTAAAATAAAIGAAAGTAAATRAAAIAPTPAPAPASAPTTATATAAALPPPPPPPPPATATPATAAAAAAPTAGAGAAGAAADSTAAVADAAAVATDARIEAGCELWDMSVAETHAAVMCNAGLALVASTVLRHCAEAESLAYVSPAASPAATEVDEDRGEGAFAGWRGGGHGRQRGDGERPRGGVVEAHSGRGGGEEGGGGCVNGGMTVAEAERLREITCGLLANVCAHRSLRRQVIEDPSLSQELLRAFHTTDDPVSLTEILRLLSVAAKTAPAAVTLESELEMQSAADSIPESAAAEPTAAEYSAESVAAAEVVTESGAAELEAAELAAESAAVSTAESATVGLGPAMATVETLERLGFFLESCLEEKLLSRACSLAHAVMYRHGDVAIRPLVEDFRLEESLALLLETRSSDLSYEQLGSTETGLDALLRCLEMLSTSELSSIGPSPPRSPVHTPTPASNDSSSSGGGRAGTTNVVNASVSASARGSVIRGLVKALMPWEHSRRSQRSALLVLGNILANVLQQTTNGDSGGVGEAQLSEYCKCATELRNAVTARCFEGEGDWAEAAGAEGGAAAELSERDCCEKLAGTSDELLGNLTGLVGGNASPGEQDEDGLEQEELLEGLDAARAMLKGWPSRQQ